MKTSRKKASLYIAQAALIAAMYAALTLAQQLILPGTASMAVQYRVSEALMILCLFSEAAVPGLTLGCFLANFLFMSALPVDMIFGSLATLLAGLCTCAAGKSFRLSLSSVKGGDGNVVKNGVEERSEKFWGASILACSMPVLFNAPIVGAVLSFTLTRDEFLQGMLIFGLQVGAGEAIVMGALALPIMRYLMKNDAVRSFLAGLS